MSPLLSLTLSSLHFSNEVIHFHGHYDSNFNVKCHLKIRSSFCLAMHSSKWVRENTNVDSEGWKQKCKTILKLAVFFLLFFWLWSVLHTHLYDLPSYELALSYATSSHTVWFREVISQQVSLDLTAECPSCVQRIHAHSVCYFLCTHTSFTSAILLLWMMGLQLLLIISMPDNLFSKPPNLSSLTHCLF